MSKPFNFFQTSESGVSGNGLVSAYSGFFSGFFTPTGMFRVRNGFIFPTDDDPYTPAQLDVAFLGFSTSSNLHESSMQCSFRGSMFPVLRESGDLSFKATGKQVRDNIDNPTYQSSFTGRLTQDGIDSSSVVPSFTGNFPRSQVEGHDLTQRFSGDITPQFTDLPSYTLSFSGNIVKYERDQVLLGAGIDYIEWRKGNPEDNDSYAESGILSFEIDFICWSNGGC